MATILNQIHYRDHSCELHVFEIADGWHVIGFIGDAEVDTQWLEMHGLTFEDVNALILEVMQEEF